MLERFIYVGGERLRLDAITSYSVEGGILYITCGGKWSAFETSDCDIAHALEHLDSYFTFINSNERQ